MVASLLGLWVRIPPGHGCLSVVSVVCCHLEFSATGRSLVKGSPTGCACLIVCELETSKPMSPRPDLGYNATGRKNPHTHKSAVVLLESYLLLVCYSSFIKWNKIVDVYSDTL